MDCAFTEAKVRLARIPPGTQYVGAPNATYGPLALAETPAESPTLTQMGKGNCVEAYATIPTSNEDLKELRQLL